MVTLGPTQPPASQRPAPLHLATAPHLPLRLPPPTALPLIQTHSKTSGRKPREQLSSSNICAIDKAADRGALSSLCLHPTDRPAPNATAPGPVCHHWTQQNLQSPPLDRLPSLPPLSLFLLSPWSSKEAQQLAISVFLFLFFFFGGGWAGTTASGI